MSPDEQNGFRALGIAPNILSVLERLRFTAPTPIQEKAVPHALEGKDMIGIAETGTGKTLAFAIPMIQSALRGKLGLVVLPTRELALQVREAFDAVGGPLGVKTALLIGGESMDRQLRALKHPDVVICTPGRMLDHLEQKTISLDGVSMLVLDEADRMLDMGFAPQLKRILSAVTQAHQTMLFSATMPEDIVRIAQQHMKLPVRIEIAPPGTAPEKITQEVFFVEKHDKPELLRKLLGEYKGSTLVFARTKFGAKRITVIVRAAGHAATELHSNKSLNQRKEALGGFRNGKYRVLVATDIAARGIDVKNIELVVNYDLPDNPADYIHRIGRTGRAGGAGHAVSFATPDQKRDVTDIERLMRVALPLSKLPPGLPTASPPKTSSAPHRPSPRPSGFRRNRAPTRGWSRR